VVKKTIRKTRKPTPKRGRLIIPRGRFLSSTTVQAAAQFIRGICQNRILPSADLPCTDSRPFRETIVHWRCVPIIDLSGKATIVFNPHQMWNNWGLTYNSSFAVDGSSTATAHQPPVYNAQTTTYQLQDTNGITSVSAVDASSTDYSGFVRFLGAEVTFMNTATVLNTGGQLYYTHNPEGRSLLGTQYYNPASTTQTLNILGATIATVNAATDVTAFCPVGTSPIHFCILPHTTEFESVTTDVSLSAQGGQYGTAAAGIETSRVMDYVPDQTGEKCHRGWNYAMSYQPAQSITPGQPAQCVIDIEAHYHLDVDPCATTASTVIWGSPVGTSLTRSTKPDPVSQAAVSAALAAAKLLNSRSDANALRPVTAPTPPSVTTGIMNAVAGVSPQIAQIATTPGMYARQGASTMGLGSLL
jgi:hypothetical protein